MGWVFDEAVWLIGPAFVDVLEDGEALQCLQSLGEVVSVDEGLEVLAQSVVRGIVVSPHSRFLQCAIHPLDLTIGPGMADLGEPVFDPVFPATHVEHVRHVLRGWPVGVSGREGELYAVIGQNRMDRVRTGLDQGFQEG